MGVAASEGPVNVSENAHPRTWESTSKHVLLVLILPSLSIAYLWGARRLALPPHEFVVSPAAFPAAVGVGLVCVTVYIAVDQLRRRRNRHTGTDPNNTIDVADDSPMRSDEPLVWVHVATTASVFLVYALLMPRIGYLVATPLLIGLLSTYLDRRRWIRNAVVAFTFTVAVFLLFERLLGIPLP